MEQKTYKLQSKCVQGYLLNEYADGVLCDVVGIGEPHLVCVQQLLDKSG